VKFGALAIGIGEVEVVNRIENFIRKSIDEASSPGDCEVAKV
jgi:hypothetical protein